MAVVCVLNSFFWLQFNSHFFYVFFFISLAIFLRISLTLICNFHLAKICLLANHDFCLRRFVRRCSIDYWAFKIIEPNGKPHRVTEPDNYYDCVLFLFFAFVLWLPTMWLDVLILMRKFVKSLPYRRWPTKLTGCDRFGAGKILHNIEKLSFQAYSKMIAHDKQKGKKKPANHTNSKNELEYTNF